MSPERRTIIHNLAALASTQAAGRVIRFLYLVAIARFLDAGDVGLFSYGMAFYLSLAGLGIFGQDALLATRVGRKRRRFAVIAAHSLTLLVGALAAVAGVGLAFLWLTENDPTVSQALAFFLLALVARGFAAWVRGCYVALEKTTWIPRYEFAFRGLEAVSGIAALALGGGLLVICFLHFAFWAVEAAASFGLLVRETEFRLRLGTDLRLLRHYASASLPMMLGLWLLFLFPQIGIVGLRHLAHETADVAYFAIAMQFVTTLLVLPVSFSQAILPGLTRAQRSRNETDLFALVTVLKACLIGGALAAAIAGAIGPWLVAAVFGGRYLAAGEAFARLMWGLGPLSAAFIAIPALNGLGARAEAARAAVAMVALQAAGMAAIGGPGGTSAATATIAGFLLASLVGAVWSCIALARSLGLDRTTAGSGGWWQRPVGILVACAIPGLGGWPGPLWGAAAAAALALVGTIGLGVFSRQELAVLRAKAGIG